MGKTLVAYFSASGTTAKAAKELADAISADVYEIKPVAPYTKADLNWMDKKSRSSVEMNDRASRPQVVTGDVDITAYDTVFLGFPIWWYTAPTIINSFLESRDFSGKRIIVFATSGGSGLGKTVRDLQASAPAAQFVEGKILNGRNSAADLKAWAESVRR